MNKIIDDLYEKIYKDLAKKGLLVFNKKSYYIYWGV